MQEHKADGNLSWTIGHSFENYFIESAIIVDAYRYLTESEFKMAAASLFKKTMPSALKIIATISLAAKDISNYSYPLGVISWEHFSINNEEVIFDIDKWRDSEQNDILTRFKTAYKKYQPIIDASNSVIYARICRGHTAMQLLQRVFAQCLFHVGQQTDTKLASKSAEDFSKIKERLISGALGEAWLKTIQAGSLNYPTNLVESISA